MELLQTGIIIGTFKLDGVVKVKSTTTNPEKRYQKGNKVFVCKENNQIELTISSYRGSGDFDFISFEEINNVDDATALIGFTIKVTKDNSTLEDGEYYFVDLIGCKIIDQNEIDAGIVVDIKEFPAQITLEVKTENSKYYLPFVKEFIKNVDIEKKVIEASLIEGMR